MARPRIGMMTIGQSPRPDIVPDMISRLPHEVDVLEIGALDNLSLDDVRKLAPHEGEPWVVTAMRDGTEVFVAKRQLDPLMQQCVDQLEQQGVDLIVPLCASDWSSLSCSCAFINPGIALDQIVQSMTRPRGVLGIVAPTEPQAMLSLDRWAGSPLRVVASCAQPFASDAQERDRQCEAAGKKLADENADLIYMNCMGHNEHMRSLVRQTSQRPTVTANGLISSLISHAIA